MKKTLIFAIIVFSISLTKAQNTETVSRTTTTTTTTSTRSFGLSHADSFITGGINYNTIIYGENTDQVHSFVFSSRFGGFVSDHFAIGISLAYENAPLASSYLDKQTDLESFDVGAFSRYYFQPNRNFSIFLDFNITQNYTTLSRDVGNSYYYSNSTIEKTKFKGTAVAFAPGLNYFLNTHFAIEAIWGSIKYETSRKDEENSESLNSFNIGLSLEDITLGLL